MNVTEVPGQIVVAEAAIETAGAGAGKTFIVTPVDVAETGLAHGALDVITTVTTWPLVKLVELNEGLFVPTGLPFTCHW